ncbi:MAG: hypothetical protein ACRDRL_00265 [Sciscionella sp.]
MKVQLRAGAELDLLTADELREHLDGAFSDYQDWALEREGQLIRVAAAGESDATGRLLLTVATVPVGFTWSLHLLALSYVGALASAPATCDVRIYEGDASSDLRLRALNNFLPTVFTASNPRNAPSFQGGEAITLRVIGGPASVVCTAGGQVRSTRPPSSQPRTAKTGNRG